MELHILVVLLLSALAGARLWRLVAIDDAGSPLRTMYYGVIPNRWFGWAESLLNCPFCAGFWITSVVFALGLAWGDNWPWQLIAGVFAANYVGAQLNAWLDIVPLEEPVNTAEGTEADGKTS